MNMKYNFEHKQSFLLLTIFGHYNIDEFKFIPKIVRDECEKENINKVIVNALNVTGTDISTMDRFFFGEEVARLLGSKIKAALVWPQQHIDKFGETVAVNRGGILCVLNNIESAEKWLFEEERS